MPAILDETHAAGLRSWVESADDGTTDFPLRNLPFARSRRAGTQEGFRIGVGIGDQVLDLRRAGLIQHDDMNRRMAVPRAERQQLRLRLSHGLRTGSEQATSWRAALVAQREAEFAVPCRIGDDMDFYTGIHHATTVGSVRR